MHDQRITRVSLTQLGEAISVTAGESLLDLNTKLTEGFEEEELAVVERWLRHSARVCDSHANPELIRTSSL